MSTLFSTILWNTMLAGGLAIIVYLMQRLSWLRSRPGLSHFLWLLVLVKLIVPPVYTVPVTVSATVQQSSDTAGVVTNLGLIDGFRGALPVVARNGPNNTYWTPKRLCIVLAMAGTVTFLSLVLFRARRISRLLCLADLAPAWLQDMTQTLAEGMKVPRQVTVLTIDGCVSPFLWITRQGPSIVVPSALIDDLERESLRLIVRHELLHYVRRDHWTNAFSLLVGSLLWWNPVAWWARRELRFVQELCCDAAVLATDTRLRRRYAETLLQTIDFVASDEATISAPTTAFGSGSTFRRRIEMISQRDLTSHVPFVTRMLVLPLGAFLIAASPTFAHDDDTHDNELADVRQELRELRAAVNDLQSFIKEVTDDRREERENEYREEREEREESLLTRSRLSQLAERANLNERERKALDYLAEMVDGNPRQFKRLIGSDDLNDFQKRVMEKLAADNDRVEVRDNVWIDELRLNRNRLSRMAERANLNERERDVLFQLAERVDGNPRQFERLIHHDNLNETEMRVLKKLANDEDHRSDRDNDDREDGWLTKSRLNRMAERANLNEREKEALFHLASTVDGNPRQFERLIRSDDLDDTQLRVLKKVARPHGRRVERDDDNEL